MAVVEIALVAWEQLHHGIFPSLLLVLCLTLSPLAHPLVLRHSPTPTNAHGSIRLPADACASSARSRGS